MRRFAICLFSVVALLGCGGGNRSATTSTRPEKAESHSLLERIASLREQGMSFIHLYDEGDSIAFYESLSVVDSFAMGIKPTFPAEDAKWLLDSYAFKLGDYFNHSFFEEADEQMVGEDGFFFLLEQVIALTPSVGSITDFCSDDGAVGVLNYHEWNPNALYSFVIYRKGERLTAELIGSRTTTFIDAIYPLSDSQGRNYYLLSNNLRRRELYELQYCYDPFCQYLYEMTDDGLILRCSISGEPFECSDYNYIIFNPRELRWNHCYQKGDLYYAREGSKTLRLTLDGENSRFSIE